MAAERKQPEGLKMSAVTALRVNDANEGIAEYKDDNGDFGTILYSTLDEGNPILQAFVVGDTKFNNFKEVQQAIDDVKDPNNYKSLKILVKVKMLTDKGEEQKDCTTIMFPFHRCITGYNAEQFIKVVKETMGNGFSDIADWSFVKYNTQYVHHHLYFLFENA